MAEPRRRAALPSWSWKHAAPFRWSARIWPVRLPLINTNMKTHILSQVHYTLPFSHFASSQGAIHGESGGDQTVCWCWFRWANSRVANTHKHTHNGQFLRRWGSSSSCIPNPYETSVCLLPSRWFTGELQRVHLPNDETAASWVTLQLLKCLWHQTFWNMEAFLER